MNTEINLTEAIEFIKNSSPESSIYVGCDSKRFGRKKQKHVAYACVIVVHLDSNHGAKMFKYIKVERDFGSLKQRLLQEVMMACEVGYNIADAVGDRVFEIHLDINPNPKHKSSVAVKEATGYVLGTFGFAPKLKPESFASSAAADRIVVKASGRKERRKLFVA